MIFANMLLHEINFVFCVTMPTNLPHLPGQVGPKLKNRSNCMARPPFILITVWSKR